MMAAIRSKPMAGKPPAPPAPQRARVALRIGRGFDAQAEAAMTPGGLLAIGGLVAMILLSTAVVVRAARHHPD